MQKNQNFIQKRKTVLQICFHQAWNILKFISKIQSEIMGNIKNGFVFLTLFWWNLKKVFERSFFIQNFQNSSKKSVTVMNKNALSGQTFISSFSETAVTFCHFFSQNFYIIRLLKTTHPIKFFDSSNWAQISSN